MSKIFYTLLFIAVCCLSSFASDDERVRELCKSNSAGFVEWRKDFDPNIMPFSHPGLEWICFFANKMHRNHKFATDNKDALEALFTKGAGFGGIDYTRQASKEDAEPWVWALSMLYNKDAKENFKRSAPEDKSHALQKQKHQAVLDALKDRWCGGKLYSGSVSPNITTDKANAWSYVLSEVLRIRLMNPYTKITLFSDWDRTVISVTNNDSSGFRDPNTPKIWQQLKRLGVPILVVTARCCPYINDPSNPGDSYGEFADKMQKTVGIRSSHIFHNGIHPTYYKSAHEHPITYAHGIYFSMSDKGKPLNIC